MKKADEYLNKNVSWGVIQSIVMDDILQAIRCAQKDAYNEELEDATKKAEVCIYRNAYTMLIKEDEILKLKKL